MIMIMTSAKIIQIQALSYSERTSRFIYASSFLFIFSLYSHIYILILSHHIVIGSHTFLSNSQVTLILSLPPPLFVAVCYSPQTSPAISFSLQPKNYKIVQTYSMSRNISETPFRISLLQCFCECYWKMFLMPTSYCYCCKSIKSFMFLRAAY